MRPGSTPAPPMYHAPVPSPDPTDLLAHHYQALIESVRRSWRVDEERAMDLVHDAIVRVYESFGTFDPGKGEFRGWVWGILRHVAAPKKQVLPGPEPVEHPEPLADLVVDEVAGFIRASVGALPEAYRKTVELRFYAGKPLGEIAKDLGVPIGTVKARLSRAPEMLRQSTTVQATTARLVLERMKKKPKG